MKKQNQNHRINITQELEKTYFMDCDQHHQIALYTAIISKQFDEVITMLNCIEDLQLDLNALCPFGKFA